MNFSVIAATLFIVLLVFQIIPTSYAAGHRPTAIMWVSVRSAGVNQPVTFVSKSIDQDGDISKYSWVYNGVVISKQQIFSYKFQKAGVHTVWLKVCDKTNLCSWAPPQKITVSAYRDCGKADC